MHKDVIWFDTVPCVTGPFIGDINKVSYRPEGKSSWDKTIGDESEIRDNYDDKGEKDGNARDWKVSLA